MIGRWCWLVAMSAALAATPAMAQNLITNPIFENLGFGNFPSNWTFAPGDQTPNSTIWGPGPGPMTGTEKAEGNWTIAGTNYASIQSGEDPTVWTARQVINVTAGNEYRLTGWYGGGSDSSGAPTNATTLFVRVLDGSGLGGAVLTAANTHIQAVNAGFGWRQFERHFTASSGQVTVVFGWESTFDWYPRGVHVDDLSLTVQAACATQHEVSSASNASWPLGSDATGVVISGSGLDQATGVRLVATGHGTLTEFPGTITNHTATEITADFPTSTAGFGRYDIVVEQDGCTERYLPLAFEIACNVVAFTTIGADRAVVGSGLHTIELGGSNLDAAEVNSVNLVKSRDAGGNVLPFSVPGTNIRDSGASPNTILVDFDLGSNLEAGRYAVEVDANHPCGSSFVIVVGGFATGFLLALPLNDDLDDHGNLKAVWNGSFEDGFLSPDWLPPLCDRAPEQGGANPKPLHWDMNRDPGVGGFKRDGNVLGPECIDGAPRNVTGNHYAGIDIHAPLGVPPKDISFFQTIEISDLLDANDQLIEDFNIRAEFGVNGGGFGSDNTGYIYLIDGTESDRQQEFFTSFVQQPADAGLVADPAYNVVIPAGTAWQTTNPPLLTVELRMTTTGSGEGDDPDGWLLFHALWVDNVRTGPFIDPLCNDPFADADGDGDVDQDDFAVFQRCLSDFGDDPYCVCFDRGDTGAVDSTDLVAFTDCFTGPTVLHADNPNPNCSQQP